MAVAVPWVVTRGVVAVDPPVVAFAGLLRRLRVEAGLSRTPSDSHPAHQSTQRMTGSPGFHADGIARRSGAAPMITLCGALPPIDGKISADCLHPVVAYGRPYCTEQVVLSVRLGCRPRRAVGPSGRRQSRVSSDPSGWLATEPAARRRSGGETSFDPRSLFGGRGAALRVWTRRQPGSLIPGQSSSSVLVPRSGGGSGAVRRACITFAVLVSVEARQGWEMTRRLIAELQGLGYWVEEWRAPGRAVLVIACAMDSVEVPRRAVASHRVTRN